MSATSGFSSASGARGRKSLGRRKAACHEAVRQAVEALERRLMLAVTPSVDGLTATFTGDAANNALFLRVSAADNNLEYSTDGVNYSEDLDATEPDVQALPAAALASVTVSMGTGSDTLRIDATLNAAMTATGGTLTFTGGGGVDTLVGPAANSTWRLTGTDAGSLNGWVQFTGVANLAGAAANSDVFVLEPTGSSSGTLDGGAGGADEILPSSGSTDVIGYTPGGVAGDGTVQRNGATIALYTGIELTSGSTGNPVTRRFEGTCDADRLRIYRPAPGQIAIYAESDNPVIGPRTIVFDDPTGALVIDLGHNPALTDEHVYIESLGDFDADIRIITQSPVGDGPATVEIQGNLNLMGHSLEVQTGHFTVKSGVQIVTSVPDGTAGEIHVLANHIKVENGAGLLALGATPGTILLQAENANTYFTPLINIDITDTDVVIGDATIRGGFISITSLSDTQHILDLNDSQSGQFDNGFPTGTTFGSVFGTILDGVLGALELGVFAGIAVGKSTATIDVAHGATISAASDLIIHASGLARASTAPVLQKGGGIAVGVAITDAEVNLDGTISSGGDMTIRATADHRVDVLTDTSGAKKVAAAVAVSVIDSNATAHVLEGANLTVGGDLSVQSDTIDRNRTLARSTSGTDGMVAMSAAVSVEHGQTRSLLDGNADVTGSVSVNAQQLKEANTANKIFVIPGWATGVAAVAGAGINTTGDFMDDTKSALVANAISLITGLFSSEQNKWVNGTIAKDNVSAFELSGAVAVVIDTNNVTARIGDGVGSRADVEADGSVEVTATIENRPDITASSSAIAAESEGSSGSTSQGSQSTQFGGSAAVAVGSYHNNANAYIAEDADVDAKQGVLVAARTLNQIDPMSLWGANLVAPFLSSPDFTSDQGVQTVHNGDIVEVAGGHTGGGDEGSWYKYVGGGSNTIDLSTADFKDANIWFELGSPTANTGMNVVRTWTTYLNDNIGLDNNLVDNWTQAVAQNQELSIAGAVSILNLDHTATAEIRGGANVNQDVDGRSGADNFRSGDQDVVVTAQSVNMVVSLGGNFQTPGISGDTNKFTINPQLPGAGSKNSSDGTGAVGATVMLFDEDNDATALIADGADVYADSLEVSADTLVVNAALGASGGVNIVNRDTQAVIGNLFDDLANDARQDLTAGGDVLVHARNSGFIGSFAVAGSVSSQNSDSSPQGDSGMTTGGGTSTTNPMDMAAGPIIGQHRAQAGDTSSDPADGGAGTNTGKAGISISGAVALDIVDDNARAYVRNTGAVTISGGELRLVGENATSVGSLAGAVALSLGGGSSQTTQVGIAGAVGLNFMDGNTEAYLDGATSLSSTGFDAEAKRSGYIASLTAGVAGAVGRSGYAVAGSAGVTRTTYTTEAALRNTSGTVNGAVNVRADDDTNIVLVNGAGGFGGKVGVGAAVSFTEIQNTTRAVVEHVKGDAGTGRPDFTYTGGMTIEAISDGDIIAVTASAGVGTGQGGVGIGASGTVSVNIIDNTIEAKVVDSQATAGSAGPVMVHAKDNSFMLSFAGAFGAGKTAGFGAALASNFLTNTVSATIEASTLRSTGTLDVLAEQTGGLVAAGVGGAGGKVAVAGGIAVNQTTNEIEALITGGSDVSASGAVTVAASDRSTVVGIAGGGAGGSQVAIGASVAVNLLGNTLTANIDHAHVQSTGSTLEVSASAQTVLVGVGVAGAGAGTFAGGASVAVNNISNSLTASITDSNGDAAGLATEVSASGDLAVRASDETTLVVVAGSAAGAGTAAIGAAAATAQVSNTIKAYVDGAIVRSTNGAVEILAGFAPPAADADVQAVPVGTDDVLLPETSGSQIVNITVGAAGAGTVAGGAAISLTWLRNNVQAYLSGGSDVDAYGDVTVAAADSPEIDSSAVAGAGSGTVAAAVAISYNYIGGDPGDPARDIPADPASTNVGQARAYIDASQVNSSAGNIFVLADTQPRIINATIAGSGSGAVGGGGAISINSIRSIVDASITNSRGTNANGLAMRASASDSVNVQATTTPLMIIIAGNGSGGGAAGIGAASATNDARSDINARIENSAVTATTGNVLIDAEVLAPSTLPDIGLISETLDAQIWAFAVSGAGAGGASVAGSVSLNWIRNTIDAHVSASSIVHADSGAGTVTVSAADHSTINAVAGTGSGSGGFAVGASVAYNYIGGDPDAPLSDARNTIKAYIDGSSVTAHSVIVDAFSDSNINNLCFAGSGAGLFALGGSVSLNFIRKTVDAHISGSSASVTTAGAGGDVTVSAEDRSTINVLSMQGAGAGFVAGGAALAYNDIGNTIQAYAENGTITAELGSMNVIATSDADITSVAAGVGGGGLVAVAGSAAANLLAIQTLAHISAASVTANDNVTVIADADNRVTTVGGTLAIAGVAGIGGSVVFTQSSNTTKAYIDADATVVARGVGAGASVPVWADDDEGTESMQVVRGLSVIATTNEALTPSAATAGVALPSGGGNVGIGANIMTTLISDTTEAYVDDANINSAGSPGQSVVIRAHQHTDLNSTGGTLGVGDVGLGADVHVDVINNTTKAYITNTDPGTNETTRTSVYGSAGVEVSALTREHVQEIAVGAGIGTWVGAAGAAAAVKTTSTTEAFVKEAAVTASAGNIDVLANSRTGFEFYTGALGASLAVGAGMSVAVGQIANTTTAHLDGAVTNSSGTTTVKATSDEDVASIVATAGVGSYGVSGSIAVISTNSTTSASVGQGEASRNSDVTSTAGSVVVQADNTTNVNDGLGAAAIALGGSLGAGVDVVRIQNSVTAAIDTGATVMAAQDVNVQATSNRNVDSVVVAFGISAGVGVAGAVSVISIGTGLTSDSASQVSGMADDVNGVLAPSGGFGGINSDPNDSDHTSDVIASSIAANTFTISADADATLSGTDARIKEGAHVTATAGDVTVVAHEAVNITDANDGAGQLVGSGAVGVFGVSVGGSVAITTVSGSANATIEKSAVISAGSAVGVDALYDTDLVARAYGGSAGLVGLGAQVAIIDDHSGAIAQIADGTSASDGASIIKASSINITAGGTHALAADAKGGSVGGLAAGVAVAKSHIDGSTTARLGSYSQIGQDTDVANTVGDVLIGASASNSATADEKAVSVGVLADGNGNISEVTVTPTIQASIGTSAAVTTSDGDVTVEATSAGDGASAVSQGVGGSLVAHVGVSFATALFSPSITTSIGTSSSIVAGGGAVTVRTVHNQAGNAAYAEAGASGGGALAGNGAVGTAMASARADSYIGAYATVTADHGVSVTAASSNYAHAKGGQLSAGPVAVGAASANANVLGSTLAHIDDYVLIGSAGDPVQSLTVAASASDVAFAETKATSGGVVDVDANMGAVSASLVHPTITASLGNSAVVVVDGNASITATAVGDSDASANGTNPISGVKVGGSSATTSLTPTVTASVGSFASISAGGSVTVSATHGASASIEDGSFDPAANVDSDTDCITFSSEHGLISGCTVTYLSLGATELVGGLETGRSYTVLDTPTSTSLTLGRIFDTADVSMVNDTITFGDGHGFKDNDRVIYDPRSGTVIGGLVPGTVYYVRVVDAQTIKLSTDPVSAPTSFTATNVDSASDRINLPGFANDQAVTYRAAPPYIFGTQDVKSNADTINWTGHGLVTGTEVVYHALGNAIGGIADNGHYFVVVVDAKTIKLAASYADATHVNSKGGAAPIVIDLDPGASDNDSHHSLSVPIVGLNSGQTYYVVNADGSSFQLSATPGGSAIAIDATHIPGTHTIGVEGIDFTSAGSGEQALRFDITAAATAGSVNQLSGAGGALTLVAQPTGDGIANAYAHGSSGSVLGNGVRQATSALTLVTVSARIGNSAGITSGTDSDATDRDITIAATGAASSSATSTNSASAGFGSNGSAQASALQMAINSAVIGSAVTITSGGNFYLTASTSIWGDSHADSSGGSTIKFASATASTAAAYSNRAAVGADAAITAAGDVTIEALVTNVYGHSYADANAKGLGGDATATNSVSLGSIDGDSLSQVSIGQGAFIDGANVNLLATLSKVRLDDYAKTYAAALGADSDATSTVNLYQTTDVSLATLATIRAANQIVLRSAQDDVGTHSHSNAICKAAGGDTDSHAHNETHPNATISAAADASLYTHDLYVQSFVNVMDDARTAERDGAFIDTGKAKTYGTTTTTRLINFNSDVTFAGGPSPMLVVDADGNVTVADGVFIDDTDDTSGIGPVATTQIVVQDIVNTMAGSAYFEAFGSNVNGNVARISGTQSTFTYALTPDRIDLINHSDKDLVVNTVSAINQAAPVIVINAVRVDRIGTDAFLFDIVRNMGPTVVHIESTAPAAAGTPDIIFNGLVNNPIGTTEVYNAGGDILSSGTTGILRANIVDLRADQGDIGDPDDPGHRLNVQLVQSAGRPTSLQALATAATGDVYMGLTGILRDGAAPAFTGNVLTIQAGHDLDLQLEDATRQETLNPASAGVMVVIPLEVYIHYLYAHFRPDMFDVSTLDLGAFADASAQHSVAVNSTWSLGAAELAGLIAANNINVQQIAAPATTVALVAYTDLTGTSPAGQIDVTANGDVAVTESSGAMRIGHIVSTDGSVTLTVPDTSDLINNQDLNLLPGGSIQAATTVLLNAGDDVDIPATSQITAGTSLTIYGDCLNADIGVGTTINIRGMIDAHQALVICDTDDDLVNIIPSATTQYSLDGGPHSVGDTLYFDPQGATYADDGLVITGDTFQPLSYTRFEFVNIGSFLPPAPTSVDLADDSDTGYSNTDNLTKLDNSGTDRVLWFLVNGTIAGATVTLYADGIAVGQATATSSSTLVATVGSHDLADGQHSIIARQSTDGLNESDASPALAVTVDTVGPSILSWASAALHGMGIGELGLPITSDGQFVEPRDSGISLLLLTPSEAIDPAIWSAASIGLWGNGLGRALDLSSIAITTSVRPDGLLSIAFASPLPDVAKYLVRVLGVSDLAGNDFSGSSADNQRIMTALLGDVTGDGRVNNTDVGAVQSLLNTYPISASVVDQVRSDVMLDGQINNTDVGAVMSKRGNDARFITIPSAPAGLGASPTTSLTDDQPAPANTLLATRSDSIFSDEPIVDDAGEPDAALSGIAELLYSVN